MSHNERRLRGHNSVWVGHKMRSRIPVRVYVLLIVGLGLILLGQAIKDAGLTAAEDDLLVRRPAEINGSTTC